MCSEKKGGVVERVRSKTRIQREGPRRLLKVPYPSPEGEQERYRRIHKKEREELASAVRLN